MHIKCLQLAAAVRKKVSGRGSKRGNGGGVGANWQSSLSMEKSEAAFAKHEDRLLLFKSAEGVLDVPVPRTALRVRALVEICTTLMAVRKCR